MTDHLVRPDDLFDGVAIEFHHDIDVTAVNVFHRGGVYKLTPARPRWFHLLARYREARQ